MYVSCKVKNSNPIACLLPKSGTRDDIDNLMANFFAICSLSVAPITVRTHIAHRLLELEIKTGVFTKLQALGSLNQLVSYEPQPVLAVLSISA